MAKVQPDKYCDAFSYRHDHADECLSLTLETGHQLALDVQAGRPRDSTAGAFLWPKIRAAQVVLTNSSHTEFTTGSKLYYLVQADGTAIFYDLGSKSTVRMRNVAQIRTPAG